MVTQADIAKLAGIDRTSVSKILCGVQPEHFSASVVEKVKEAAAQLGYTHKNFKNSLNVGYIFPSGASNELDEYTGAERNMAALMGISKSINGSKHHLQIVNINYELNESIDFVRVAHAADVFVIWELSWPWTKNFFDLLDKKGKDYIVINRVHPDYRGSYIIHDSDETYIQHAVDILANYGHRHIAGVFHHMPNAHWQQAMKKSFERHGMTFSQENIIVFPENNIDDCRKVSSFVKDQGFTAVFCQNNDLSAFDLYIEFRRMGLRIPDDISILGNHKRRSLIRPGFDLSSFDTPWGEMGRRAAEIMIARASRQNCSQSITREILKQTFYPGNTIRSITR